MVEVGDSVAAFGFDNFPTGDLLVAGRIENEWVLAKNNFGSLGDDFGKTVKRIGESGKIDFFWIVAKGVEKGAHFEMRVGKRVNGDFEIGFEGGTVGANVIFDGRNIG